MEKLCKKCKEQLCLYIHQAVNTAEWFLLSQELQKEIMDGMSFYDDQVIAGNGSYRYTISCNCKDI